MRKLLIALAFVASPVAAQDHPDLSGFWAPDFGPVERPQELMDKLPDDVGMVEDTGVEEFPRGEFGELVLTPFAEDQAIEWYPETEMSIARVCLPPGIVYSLQGPFPFEIHQFDDVIVIRYEYFDQTRLVFMDGREHPGEGYPHSKMGFSTGRWEGEELIVETTHLAASTITNNGLNHTDGIVMRERYRLSDDGEQLMATQWFRDREVIENDGARFISWSKREGEHVYPYECDPSFALEYQGIGAE
ncbi:hypothetical protein [Alteraurantiacibacter aquimixticola]|uniref:Uncharacterized protein n=1 Tax=Alteraurantiacibacter aquimixticola TaxID=2489173 RepID=A0A4T3FA24_9SPHN|nr:hypothetical protein [Alteraurantiacibacter aquimixticola]TIX51890.1 hypothetical protein E5222_05480 [Alteraurantiacibacter aquimixticola]